MLNDRSVSTSENVTEHPKSSHHEVPEARKFMFYFKNYSIFKIFKLIFNFQNHSKASFNLVCDNVL